MIVHILEDSQFLLEIEELLLALLTNFVGVLGHMLPHLLQVLNLFT